MKFKKGLLFLSLFILLISNVSSYYLFNYSFKDQNQNNLDHIVAIGWPCKDLNCENVDLLQPLLDNQPVNSYNKNYILVSFPKAHAYNSNNGYLIRFFKEGYKSSYAKQVLPDSLSDSPSYYDVFKTVSKKSNCNATFKPTISSCAEAGLPLSILTDTNLSAETASAFSFSGYYYPSNLYDPTYTGTNFDTWIGVNTNMYLNIMNSEGNSIVGFPSTQNHFIYSIPPNNKYNFQFTWTTSKNTEPGYYTITMRSTVPDEKCDQATMQYVEKTMTVYIAESFDGCVARLTDFGYDQSANIELGLPIIFTARKLTSYQDWNNTGVNCNTTGVLNNEIYFDTSYTIQIKNSSNRIVYSTTGILPRNTQPNTSIPFLIPWTPTSPGSYEATLTITSTGSTSLLTMCNNKGTTASSTIPVVIGQDIDHDGYYTGFNAETNILDCDDENASIHPNAVEICDQRDNDCDSLTDEEGVCSQIVYYSDIDGDGHFSMTPSGNCLTPGCNPTNSRTIPGDDCNDNNPEITVMQDYYRDTDRDGYGNPSVAIKVCPQNKPNEYIKNNTDCNDDFNTIYPGNNEICDGLDNDCNGIPDDFTETSLPYCYSLPDWNLGRLGICATMKARCNSLLKRLECSFNNYDPISEAKCDNQDNNCDGITDENCDKDKDGYADISMTCIEKFKDGNNLVKECAEFSSDCDDSNFGKNPGNEEICDNQDNNCDNTIDEGCSCSSGDIQTCGTDIGECNKGSQICENGIWGSCMNSVSPKEEICNGLDDDCDNKIDTQDGLTNCCINGQTEPCSNENCPDIEGKKICENFNWQACSAACPSSEIIFLSPKENKVYTTCTDSKSRNIEYNYLEGIQCQYKTQLMNSYSDLTYRQKVEFPIGSNIISIKCGDKTKTISFTVQKATNCINITTEQNIQNLIQPFEDLNLSGQDITDAEKTKNVLDQNTQSDYDGEYTTITHTLTPNKQLGQVDVGLFVPKCLAPYLKDMDVDLSGYKVIKDDPVIAWHFVEVKDKIELSYKVKKQVPEDCLKMIKLLPIAKLIDDKLNKKPFSLQNILLPTMIIIIVASLIIYMQRVHPEVLETQDDSEKKGIELGKKHLLKEVKEMRFKSMQQTENYMTERGFSEEEKDFIRKNL